MSTRECDRDKFRTLQEKAEEDSGELRLSALSDDEVRQFAEQLWVRERQTDPSLRALRLGRNVLDQANIAMSISREEGDNPETARGGNTRRREIYAVSGE